MTDRPTRREWLATAGAAAAGLALADRASAQPEDDAPGGAPFKLCLNTSTIRPASLEEKIDVAAQAGYDAIELWTDPLEKYEANGGSLEDLGKRIRDKGLEVVNIIGLWNCMPAEDEKRPQALKDVRRRLEIARQVGSKHFAAVPTPDRPDIEILWAAERYRELLEIGEEYGVTPAVEFVGFFKGINRLGEAVAIALEADHPDACLIADTFHLFRGGSGFNGIRHLAGDFIVVFHFNDAPADPPREQQGDKHRVLPGDGILPLVQLLRDLKRIAFTGALSLELFNRDLWSKPPLEVAQTGIEKMKRLVAAAEG